MDVKLDYETGGWFYCSIELEGFRFQTSAAVATSCVLTERTTSRGTSSQMSSLCRAAGFRSRDAAPSRQNGSAEVVWAAD